MELSQSQTFVFVGFTPTVQSSQKDSSVEPHSHLSPLFLNPECSRILPSCPLTTHLTAPIRTAAITPTCCLAPLATWVARRPATVARRTSAEEQEPPLRTSPSAATASLRLETVMNSFHLRTLVSCRGESGVRLRRTLKTACGHTGGVLTGRGHLMWL